MFYIFILFSCMQSYYEQALERCKQESVQDETYYNGLAVTTSYNMGRLHEATSQFEAAENYYKIILKVRYLLLCIYYYISISLLITSSH